MKKQNTRAMTGEEKNVKAKPAPEPETNAAPETPAKIRCTRECDMPGIGHFKHGEVVSDAGKIAQIADNPNFEIVKED